LKEVVAEHKPQVIEKKQVGKILPWVHIAISNAKRQFLNIYHQMDRWTPRIFRIILTSFVINSIGGILVKTSSID
jgi:hypothetical protein